MLNLSGFAWGLGYVGTVIIFLDILYGLFLLSIQNLFLGLNKLTYENISELVFL